MPSLKGFSLELGTGAGGQKLERWATRSTKKLDDNFSRVDRMHNVIGVGVVLSLSAGVRCTRYPSS